MPRKRPRHGMRKTPAWHSWNTMLARCRNPNAPNYRRYGGRGISVCERWLQFPSFFEDMGERPDGTSLDRIDVNGNYEPANCRWATVEEQQNNKSTNRYITVDGITKTLKQWSDASGIAETTISDRLRRGRTPAHAVNAPPHPQGVMFTYMGQTHDVRGWAKLLGLAPNTISQRLGRGWPLERALSPASRALPAPRIT